MKKATMLLMDVSATLGPVRSRHSPMRSCQDRGGPESSGFSEGWCGNVDGGGGTMTPRQLTVTETTWGPHPLS